MRIFRLKMRDIFLLLFAFILNNIGFARMANNDMDISPKDQHPKSLVVANVSVPYIKVIHTSEYLPYCRNYMECEKLSYPCIRCEFDGKCEYGKMVNVSCEVMPQIPCSGEKYFPKTVMCRYCYQTEHWEHTCTLRANCNSVGSPRQYYATNCTVLPDIFCMGSRTFTKKVLCNWTGGARWGTALILSLVLGGFGADRFYLGHWQEGIGKLFSFGGLGVWTLLDVVLISVHHLGPADGSLYI